CSPGGPWSGRSGSPTRRARSWPGGSPARRRCPPPRRSRRFWQGRPMREEDYRRLRDARVREPERIAEAAAKRRRRPLLGDRDRLLIIAADHPARGALGVGGRPMAMASRLDMLDRLMVALSRPGVDGVLGTPDVIEDLLLLGALDDKVVFGSMNRGGVEGAVFEFDDRFTAYDTEAIVSMGLDGGKMLCRIGVDDHRTADTLESCARA